MIRLFFPTLFAIAAIVAGTSNGAIVLDQNQSNTLNEITASNSDVAVQSFQQSFNNITGAAVAVGEIPVASVTIELYDDLANVGNPLQLLGTGTLTADPAVGFADSFVTVDFGGPVMVTPNTTLFLSFSKTMLAGAAGPGTFQGRAFSIDTYTFGEAFVNGSPFPASSNVDFAFQTFADNTIVAVPEPGTGIFLVASTLVLTCRRRR